jgi:hypothetical protein
MFGATRSLSVSLECGTLLFIVTTAAGARPSMDRSSMRHESWKCGTIGKVNPERKFVMTYCVGVPSGASKFMSNSGAQVQKIINDYGP